MGLFDAFRVPGIDAAGAVELVRNGAVLLDVREKNEWNAGHAPQAVHVPLGRIADAPRRLRPGQQVVVVCRSGNRSRQATSVLRSQGFEALNLQGGMRAWQDAGGSVVANGKRPGVVI